MKLNIFYEVTAMKRKKIPILLLTAVCCLAMLPTAAVTTTAAEPATQTETTVSDTELVDSGISYVETVETIANPGAGYTTTDWYTCAPGNTPIHDKNGSVVLMFIDIGKFSSGANGTTNEDGTYVVTGKKLRRIMYSVDFEDMESIQFFQKTMENEGVFDKLREMGIEDGDTVKIYEIEFEFYH